MLETESELRPPKSMMRMLSAMDWDCESDQRLLNDDVDRKARSAIKWGAAENNQIPKNPSHIR